ncbi:uncharacterized protein FIBRA_05453 [Fibroporia radiculosa]|uniref:CHAT domain-containing protein n=1 Tax=Fibroporia radiculosa TaxID=599839 RepID=J4GR14_9APHY|nr:uncharacterized protein FIBRA_05453 [Fibroporia radiculosa]CCM03325.1 predicted protein [Fibroporia radiculosa]
MSNKAVPEQRHSEGTDPSHPVSSPLTTAVNEAANSHSIMTLAYSSMLPGEKMRSLNIVCDDRHRLFSAMTSMVCSPKTQYDEDSCISNLPSTKRSRSDVDGCMSDLPSAKRLRRDDDNTSTLLNQTSQSNGDATTPEVGNALDFSSPRRSAPIDATSSCYIDVWLEQFKQRGDPAHLDTAIASWDAAVQVVAEMSPLRVKVLLGLAESLRQRFELLGDLNDLTASIGVFEEAIVSIADVDSIKSACLGLLSICLSTRFQRLGDIADTDRSVSVYEDAVRLTFHDHPLKASYLDMLGVSLSDRFDRLGNVADIDRSISVQEDAVRLTLYDHPDKPSRLGNLGNLLLTRFERLGNIADIDRAISVNDDAVRLIPHDHPDKLGHVNDLGNSLMTRFERLDDVADIERAISMQEDAVRLAPYDYPTKPTYLSNLGTSLATRFQRLGNVADIDRAISVQEDAVRLTPHDHLDKTSRLNNLGNSLSTRFERLGDVADIDRSISLQEDAVRLTPYDHPTKPGYLNNLASSLATRSQRLGNVADIDRSISVQEDAIRLSPHDHPHKPRFLNNLGISLLVRFDRLGDVADIDWLILVQEDAVRLTPDNHPHKLQFLVNLGTSFFSRFRHLRDIADLRSAISTFSGAACSSVGPSSIRLEAALRWIRCAHLISSDSLLDVYAAAIDLVPQVVWLGLPLQDRHRELLRAADVVRDAAVDALARGYRNRAVEWLEQGRSVVWNQLLQLRTPLDELQSRDPTLANRLRQVSYELEKGSGHDMTGAGEMKNDVGYLWRNRPDNTVDSQWSAKRFSPRSDTVSQLAPSAHAGPVVILNASQYRCDALVLLAESDDVLHVPLPDITYEQVENLQKSLNKLLASHGRVISRMDRAIREVVRRGRTTDESFKSILSELWKKVVRPVLDALAFSTPTAGELSRIFWCPTGPFSFLPIHAAGLYGDADTGAKLSDFLISSYTLTLSALILPPHEGTTIDNMRLVAVPQPASDRQTRLPGAQIELGHIKTTLQSLSSTPISLVQSIGTVEDVLTKMKESDWVHFACHGVQDLARHRGGLAFLSACQTATGDKDLPEEAIHLAAGMLLAGYGGVVATMWSIKDSDAPKVAKCVYEQLFRDGNLPDYRQAARALHYAVKGLREEHSAPFMSWIPFIHIGP